MKEVSDQRSRKKIAVFVVPGFGHVLPVLGLIRNLSMHHDVHVYSIELFRDHLVHCKATLIPIDEHLAVRQDEEKDMVSLTGFIMEYTYRILKKLLPEIKAADYDLVISDYVTLWGRLLAKLCAVPLVVTNPTAALSKQSFPIRKSDLLTGIKKLIVSYRVMWAIFAAPRRIRREFGISRVGIGSIYYNFSGDLLLAYMHPALVEDQRHHHPWHFIAPEFDRFYIEESDLPIASFRDKVCIYISYSSFFDVDEEIFDVFVEATHAFDAHVVIRCPDGQAPQVPDDARATYYFCSRVPQIKLLEVADIFVTHCGGCSVNEAVYTKTPMICLPQAGDHFYLAKRVEELGIGVNLDGKALDGQLLHRTMSNVLDSGVAWAKAFSAMDQAEGQRLSIEAVLEKIENLMRID